MKANYSESTIFGVPAGVPKFATVWAHSVTT